MAFGALLGSASNTSTSTATTLSTSTSLTVSVGDLVVATFYALTGLTSATFSDNLSNAWTALTGSTAEGDTFAAFTLVTVAGAMTPKVTFSSTSTPKTILAAQYSGPFQSSPLNVNPACNSSTTTTGNVSGPATGALAEATELVISYFGQKTNTAPTAVSPLNTDKTAIAGSGSTKIGAGLGSEVTSSITSTIPQWTVSAANVIGTAAFKSNIVTTVVTVDAVFGVESIVATIADDGSEAEWIRQVIDDDISCIESTSRINADDGSEIELLAIAKMDSADALESVLSLIRDAIVPSESTGITIITTDGTSNFEFVAQAKSDIRIDAEFMASLVCNGTALLESLAARSVSPSSPAEIVFDFRRDTAAQAESISSLRVDASSPLEALYATRRDTSPALDLLRSVTGDTQTALEILHGLVSDSSVPTENVGIIVVAKDSAAPLEWTGPISVTTTGGVSLEFIALSRSDLSAQVAATASLRSDGLTAAESISTLRRDACDQVETIIIAQKDSAAVAEWLSKQQIEIQGQMEFVIKTVSIGADGAFNIEILTKDTSTVGNPVSILSQTMADVAAAMSSISSGRVMNALIGKIVSAKTIHQMSISGKVGSSKFDGHGGRITIIGRNKGGRPQ